jgi:predicted MPP superfamily phosphohydrolase
MIKYIVVSDVHLGHRRTPTEHIIYNLRKTLFSSENVDVDIIFIAGDLFDRCLDFNSKDVHEIVVFLHELLEVCSSLSIKLRVLEGTPSHDWKQSRILVEMNENLREPCDLRYFSELDIEIMEDLNISVLYIPDEWNDSHEKIFSECQDKLKEKELAQVDIGIFHGQFAYQLRGPVGQSAVLKEEDFLSVVKYYINIGHYHTHSFFDRIVAQGSFDRLTHGEEEDKGFVKMTIGEQPSWEFIPNKNAYVYKTIPVRANTTLEQLDKKILNLPIDSYVRLEMKPDHPFYTTFKDLQLRYHAYRLSKKSPKEKDVKVSVKEDLNGMVSSFCLTEDNIFSKLTTEIERKEYGFESRHWNKLKSFMGVSHAE